MNNWILFAVLAWLSMWSWSFFHDKSGYFLNPIVWATYVSFVAMIIWIIIILFDNKIDIKIIESSISIKSVFFIILVWFFAFLIDFYTLKTFLTSIKISTWFSIIIITSIIFSLFLSIIFNWETVNYKNIYWIVISILWIYLILQK